MTSLVIVERKKDGRYRERKYASRAKAYSAAQTMAIALSSYFNGEQFKVKTCTRKGLPVTSIGKLPLTIQFVIGWDKIPNGVMRYEYPAERSLCYLDSSKTKIWPIIAFLS